MKIHWNQLIAPLLFLGRWIIAVPPQRPESRLRSRFVGITVVLAVLWMCTMGPAVAFMPWEIGCHSIAENNTIVFYEEGIPSDHVKNVLTYADHARLKLNSFWGDLPENKRTMTIFLCNSRSRYKQFSLWTGGNACEMGFNILLNPKGIGDDNLPAILSHEMSHIYLRRHMGYFRSFLVPPWLDEGIATYLGSPTWSSNEKFVSYLQEMHRPELVSATSLTSQLQWSNAFMNSPRAVAQQYAYVRSLTEYLISLYGLDKLKVYLRNTIAFEDDNKIFQSTYGVELIQVEQKWLTRYKAMKGVPDNTVFVMNSIIFASLALFGIRYAIIVIFSLWVIRQCFQVGRFLWNIRKEHLFEPSKE